MYYCKFTVQLQLLHLTFEDILGSGFLLFDELWVEVKYE